MWNPCGVQFPNNICPQNHEQPIHRLIALTKTDCQILVITHEVLIHEGVSKKEIYQLVLEYGCQFPIDPLVQGHQHGDKSSGTKGGTPSDADDGFYQTVGITYAPSNFYQNHPVFVIVGNANGHVGL